MKALIDGDILRYEIGFGAETGWKAITETEAIPPFDYVENLLNQRIAHILAATNSNDYCLYLTEGHTFRFDIATTKPYKGTRVEKKPWHFDNLTAYIQGVLRSKTITYIEADDALAIDASKAPEDNIICTRDKDLRQVAGWFYSWELGKQAAFGPIKIREPGHVSLSEDRKKLVGTGFSFFCGQMLVGDAVDNIPGVEGIGPVAADNLINTAISEAVNNGADINIQEAIDILIEVVEAAYKDKYEEDWEERMLEQGRLLWIVRKLGKAGYVDPIFWQRGMYK